MCRTVRLISLYTRCTRHRALHSSVAVCIGATYGLAGARFRPVQMKRARRPASGSEDEERGIILWFHWCTWVALPRAATASAHVCFVPPICLVCTLEDLYSRFICHSRPAAIYAEAMFRAMFARSWRSFSPLFGSTRYERIIDLRAHYTMNRIKQCELYFTCSFSVLQSAK